MSVNNKTLIKGFMPLVIVTPFIIFGMWYLYQVWQLAFYLGIVLMVVMGFVAWRILGLFDKPEIHNSGSIK